MQLTWKQNYEKFAKSTSLDLVNDPDLALQPSAAIRILFEGMVQGLFTGKKLGDFLAGPVPDFFNARRIVNGTDKAAEIAGFARAFESALAVVLPSVSIPLSRPGWLGRFRTYLGY